MARAIHLATHTTVNTCRSADATSPLAPDSSAQRPITPSILWFSLIALEISWLSELRIAEADIWFHLRNAQELLTRHSFLRADLYTFTAASAPLVNFEWLSELPYYLGFHLWDLRGLLFVYVLLLWLIFAGVYYLALRRGASSTDAALVTIAGVFVGSYSFGPRMLHFGWLCLVGVLLVLERFQRAGKGLWMLPPIFALWINLHGSWVFGFVVLGICIVSGLLEGHWKNIAAERWTPIQLRTLLFATAASIVALFANPYGYKLVWYPFELLYRQRQVQEIAPEWQSVDFHTLWGKLAMLMIFALLASAWFSPKPWRLSDILLASFAVWAALSHLRFLLFAAIILIPILASHLELLPPAASTKSRSWPNLIVAAVVVIIIVRGFPSNVQLHKVIDTAFPNNALRFIQDNHIEGRLFSAGPFSGYTEFYAPALKTFADGRLDIFVYNGVIDDYFRINRIERPLELLDRYCVEYVLIPPGQPLTYVLDRSANWRSLYEDQTAKLYERVPSQCVGRR